MIEVPFIDLYSQYLLAKRDIDDALSGVIKKSLFVGGDVVENFERDFAKYIGVKFIISVNSGTDALILGMRGLDLPRNSEVMLPANTFFSTALAAISNNLTPVFVDIDEKDNGINLKDLEKKMSNKTKAIILVHMYGQSDKINEVKRIIKKTGREIHLVEDACQSHGSYYNDHKIGTYGVFSAFSFYPTKNLGGFGDGGAIATNNKKLFQKYRLLRQYGSVKKYYHDEIGFNSRLDSLQAAVLSAKLNYLDSWNLKRQKAAYLYDKLLSGLSQYVITPTQFQTRKSVYYTYVIRAKNRDKLMLFLKSHGINTVIHYPLPLHLQKAYAYLGYSKGDLPIVEKVSKEILSLPMFESISVKQIKYVANTIKQFYRNASPIRINQ